MDPEEDGAATAVAARGEDVERQAVLVGWRVRQSEQLADHAAGLRRRGTEGRRLAYTGPRLDGLRSAQPQRTDGRAREGNPSKDLHSLAGRSCDSPRPGLHDHHRILRAVPQPIVARPTVAQRNRDRNTEPVPERNDARIRERQHVARAGEAK